MGLVAEVVRSGWVCNATLTMLPWLFSGAALTCKLRLDEPSRFELSRGVPEASRHTCTVSNSLCTHSLHDSHAYIASARNQDWLACLITSV